MANIVNASVIDCTDHNPWSTHIPEYVMLFDQPCDVVNQAARQSPEKMVFPFFTKVEIGSEYKGLDARTNIVVPMYVCNVDESQQYLLASSIVNRTLRT